MDGQPLRAAGERGAAPNERVPRVLRFLVVGGLSAALDVGLLVVLRELVGAPLGVATTVAFWTALVVNFSLHRTWSFSHASAPAVPFARYLVLVGANYLATLGLVTGGVAVGAPYVLAKVVAIGVGVAWTFVAYERWVFA